MSLSPDELRRRIIEVGRRENKLLRELVEPARAAANAMLDAGMKRTGDLVAQKIFEIDATAAEIKSLIENNPVAAAEAAILLLRNQNEGGQ